MSSDSGNLYQSSYPEITTNSEAQVNTMLFRSTISPYIHKLASAHARQPIPYSVPVLDSVLSADGHSVTVRSRDYPGSRLPRYVQTCGSGKGLDCQVVIRIARQLTAALKAGHNAGFVHANLNANAVWVRGDNAEVGLWFYCFESYQNSVTRDDYPYEAPEISVTGQFSEKSDVYSLGQLFLYLSTGCDPVNISQYEFFSGSFYYLIKSMTSRNASKRPSLSEVQTALEDDFGTQGKLAKLLSLRATLQPSIKAMWNSEYNKQFQDDSTHQDAIKSDQAWIFSLLCEAGLNIDAKLCEAGLNIDAKQSFKAKFADSEAREIEKFAMESLNSALIYQKHQIYTYALFCYFRATLALKIAKSNLKSDWKEVCDISKTMKSCFANHQALKQRFVKA